MDFVRKGDRADTALAGRRDPELCSAMDDLVQLAELGVLAGVGEIIRERVRQVLALGYTAEHDDAHVDGRLAVWAEEFLRDGVQLCREAGLADAGSDETALRKAGALAAAEIDRLNRMMTTDDPR